MPWNDGGPGQGDGPNPWGSPGGPRPGPRPVPPRGRPFPGPPDLDRIIAQLQAWARRLLPGGGAGGRGLALLAVVVVALWLASGFYRVQPDEQGVVLRFGAFVRTTAPGLNYHLPWPIETVDLPAVTRINRIDVGFSPAPSGTAATAPESLAARDIPQESEMLTGDANIIDINFSVFWRIRSASEYLFDTRHPAATVKAAAESVIREVIGRTPIQPALAEARAQIETEVTKGTQAILDRYRTGVEITQVQLLRVDPPAAVVESFRDVQRASTDADRLRNEAQTYHNDIVPRARGDAARIVASADAERQAAIAQATGEGQRFDEVLAAYRAAKDVTLRRLYIDTMQDILAHAPSTVLDGAAGNVLPLLPLGARPVTLPPVAPPSSSSSSSSAPKAATP
jgi:membrane protease subunit HflK